MQCDSFPLQTQCLKSGEASDLEGVNQWVCVSVRLKRDPLFLESAQQASVNLKCNEVTHSTLSIEQMVEWSMVFLFA